MERILNRRCDKFNDCTLRPGQLDCAKCDLNGDAQSPTPEKERFIYGRRNQVDFLLDSIRMHYRGKAMSKYTALAYVQALAYDASTNDPDYETMIHPNSFGIPAGTKFLKWSQVPKFTDKSMRELLYEIGSNHIAAPDTVGQGVKIYEVGSARAVKARCA